MEKEGSLSTDLRNFTGYNLLPPSSCFSYRFCLRHWYRLKIPRLSPARLQIHPARLWLEHTSLS
jgi:hypothetical protein